MRAGTSNKAVMIYPARMWQVLKIVAVLLAVSGAAFAADDAILEIPNADGNPVRPFAESKDRKATLFFFISHDCPIANGYAPEIQRIAKEYAERGVAVFLVHTDASLKQDAAKKHAAEFGYALPVLLDGSCKLARRCGATITPEAALFAADGSLQYLGRIDDRHVDFGKKRAEPTRRDLRIALDEMLAGKPVSIPRAPAVGCYIPDSEGVAK